MLTWVNNQFSVICFIRVFSLNKFFCIKAEITNLDLTYLTYQPSGVCFDLEANLSVWNHVSWKGTCLKPFWGLRHVLYNRESSGYNAGLSRVVEGVARGEGGGVALVWFTLLQATPGTYAIPPVPDWTGLDLTGQPWLDPNHYGYHVRAGRIVQTSCLPPHASHAPAEHVHACFPYKVVAWFVLTSVGWLREVWPVVEKALWFWLVLLKTFGLCVHGSREVVRRPVVLYGCLPPRIRLWRGVGTGHPGFTLPTLVSVFTRPGCTEKHPNNIPGCDSTLMFYLDVSTLIL